MKRIATLVLLLIATTGIAQVKMSRYIVALTDKKGTPYTLSDPSAYLSAKSIARRINQARPFDSTDLPVNPAYIKALRNVPYVIAVINNSKWLNQVLVQIDTSDEIKISTALAGINALPFVKKAGSVGERISTGNTNSISNILADRPVQAPVAVNQEYGPTGSTTAFNYGAMYNQIHISNGDFLHNLGFSGRGMTIAVIDGGFRNYLNNPVFDSVRLQGRILGTWDYVEHEADVNDDITHGANVLSLLASNRPGILVGTAPHASYWLLKSEDDLSEYPVEEQNWAVAAEFADSAGVDMISTSLGYIHFDDASYDHPYAQRNGNTSMVTRAADLAAKKGILVVVAAGNDGRSVDDTKYISCPADADSVLTVGSINVNGDIASSSSWGPNGAGLLKPNVVAVGENAVIANWIDGSVFSGSGTSYACPNMAGMVACLWQMFPEVSNMQVINAVQQSASKSANPDFRFGNGIPDFKKAIPLLTKQFASASMEFNNCITSISWKSKDDTSSVYTLQRKLPGETGYVNLRQINSTSPVFTTNSYSYNDTIKTAGAGAIQYRILQTMRSVGATIEIASLQQNNTAVCFPDNTLMIMPSPFDQQLLVVLNTPETIPNMGIKITDMMGRVMFTQKANKPAGYFSASITTTGWNTGIYEVTVYNNDKRMYARKVLK